MENDGAHVDYLDKPLMKRLRDGLGKLEKEAHAQYVEAGKLLRKKVTKPTQTPGSTSVPTPFFPPSTPTPLPATNLYLDRHSQLHSWLAANKNHPSYNLLKTKIADVPKGMWVSSNWPTDVERVAKEAKAEGTTPIFIVYNAIGRDLGGESHGGAQSLSEYLTWLTDFSNKLADIPYIAIMEPDALPHMPAMNSAEQKLRVEMYQKGLAILRRNPKVKVYADIGHSRWLSADQAAGILNQIGVNHFDGFALNVSNRRPNDELLAYGKAISEAVGKPFVIDTSRNAIPQDDWCNPAPEGCGVPPTFETGEPLCDAFLWLKSPGESDGRCNGGPDAGALWLERAIMLATHAV